MAILFFISLILAWPTNGLSIIAMIAIYLGKVYFQNKARNYDRNKNRAQQKLLDGARGYPSWINDKNQQEIFSSVVNSLLVRKKVPPHYLNDLFKDKEAANSILYYVSSLEKEGASFIEQQSAAAEIIYELWEKGASTSTVTPRQGNTLPPQNNIQKIAVPPVQTGTVNPRTVASPLTFKIHPDPFSKKESNKKSYENFYYLMENKKTKIENSIAELKINKSRYRVDYLEPEKYSNKSLAKISISLLNTDQRDHNNKPEKLKIDFFSIDKNTEKKIAVLFLLYKKMDNKSFFNFIQTIPFNHSKEKNCVIGDNIKLSYLVKAGLNERKTN